MTDLERLQEDFPDLSAELIAGIYHSYGDDYERVKSFFELYLEGRGTHIATLYLVHFDGYQDFYNGCMEYLLGIYSTKRKAEEAIKEYMTKMDICSKKNNVDLCINDPEIEVVKLDHTYDLKLNSDGDIITEIFLCGRCD